MRSFRRRQMRSPPGHFKNVLYKNKMGLRVLASVTTPQGFTASALYLRIVSLFVMRPQDPLPVVKIRTALYLSRDRQTMVGSEIEYPAIPREYDIELPLASVPSFDLLYAHVRAILRRRGFTCETVAEDGQTVVEIDIPDPVLLDASGNILDVSGSVMDVSGASPQSSESTPSTLLTPPPPSESPESSPEPQQPPSSEYAPAPATTEA
jgi:hypothetical protein